MHHLPGNRFNFRCRLHRCAPGAYQAGRVARNVIDWRSTGHILHARTPTIQEIRIVLSPVVVDGAKDSAANSRRTSARRANHTIPKQRSLFRIARIWFRFRSRRIRWIQPVGPDLAKPPSELRVIFQFLQNNDPGSRCREVSRLCGKCQAQKWRAILSLLPNDADNQRHSQFAVHQLGLTPPSKCLEMCGWK